MRKLVICVIVLALFVPTAAAGPAPPAPIDIDFRKSPRAPWIDYSSMRKNVGQKTVSVFWRARNQDTEHHVVDLTENLGGEGVNDYRIRWFRGKTDVTKKVTGPGYEFSLSPDDKRKFEVTIKARKANPKPVCITPFFNVAGDPTSYSYGLYVNDDGVCG